MSRPLRLEFPGALFHITQRGNHRQDIFVDDADRHVFLELLGRCVNKYGWILTSYVLMSNHFHFVVQLTCNTLWRGMQWFETQYVRAFNRRHDRIGHLFQGPFDSPLVEKETYGLNVLRYDVLNPVRAGMVRADRAGFCAIVGDLTLAQCRYKPDADDPLPVVRAARRNRVPLWRRGAYRAAGRPRGAR